MAESSMLVPLNARRYYGTYSIFRTTSRDSPLKEVRVSVAPLGQGTAAVQGMVDLESQAAAVVLSREEYDRLWAALWRRGNSRLTVRYDGPKVTAVECVQV